jgi:hypothetical protein
MEPGFYLSHLRAEYIATDILKEKENGKRKRK